MSVKVFEYIKTYNSQYFILVVGYYMSVVSENMRKYVFLNYIINIAVTLNYLPTYNHRKKSRKLFKLSSRTLKQNYK